MDGRKTMQVETEYDLGTDYTIEELIAQGSHLKEQLNSATAALMEIHKKLAEVAPFKDGAKSTSVYGAGYKVRIQLRDNVSWSQEKLQQAKGFLPEDQWNALFKTVFEPSSKKALDSFFANGDPNLVGGIRWAMTVKPGQPNVTYERIEEEAPSA
jgi:hypothetical protein